MTWPKNAMDVFKLLNKSNCRECGAPTCLAFAAAVFKGEMALNECPHLEPGVLEQYAGANAPQKNPVADIELQLEHFKKEIQSLDLAQIARPVGGQCNNGKLTIKIMGKDFSVDSTGNLISDLHVHGWIVAPFLEYLKNSQGVADSGKWVPLRELENGRDWDNFFTHRCEKPMKKVADAYPELFEDMIHLFNGRQVENHYQSDISLILHPFPRLPMLICYWKPEDGMASDLNLFFDANADKNLPVGAIYMLGTGLVQMFEKIARRHGISST